MRRLTPLILGVALAIGISLYIFLRAQDLDAQYAEHRGERELALSQLGVQLEHIANEVRIAGTSRTVREFARETLLNTTGSSLENAQTALLGELTSLINQQSDIFIAARYVTFNGSIWSQVTHYDNLAPRADASIRLNELANEPTFARALEAPAGTVAAGQLEYVRSAGSVVSDVLLPFVRFSTPVVSDTNLTSIAGVLQFEVRVDQLIAYAREFGTELLEHDGEGHQIVLIDDQGRILADSARRDINYLSELEAGNDYRLRDSYPEYFGLMQPDADTLEATRGSLLISIARLPLGTSEGAVWRLVLVEDVGISEGGFVPVAALLFSVAFGGVIAFAANILIGQALRGFRAVNVMAANLTTEGAVAASPVELPPDTDDEVAQLMRAFTALNGRVEQLSGDLSEQKQRYSRSMDIAGRISRETAALYDIDTLLNRAITLIVSSYGFYHAQVFLLDDIGQNAILSYSYGEVGKQLLAQRHKIRVGSESVIGTVTKSGRPVVINNTTRRDEGITHRFNPLLPDTRAEMAIALRIGDRVIGALDIQSNEINAFQDEDLRTFQMLADQIAIAIQNVRLLVESEARVEQIDTLNRQLTRMAWEETSQRANLAGVYRYDLMTVERAETAPEMPTGLSVPISIRGEVIGMLEAAPPDGLVFTEGDHSIMRAVADRVAIAIENARLFEQSQSTLAETYTLYQLSRYLNEANSLEDIVQAIIISVMPDASGGQIGVFDDYQPGSSPTWLEISADWSASEKDQREIRLTGIELHLPDHPLFQSMSSTQVTLINDTERDTRIDDVARAIIDSTHARSMVLIPFNVRGVWRGVVVIEFPQPREFTERDGRIYTALIDQAGVAIDNRMLLRQNEAQLHEIERLYTGSRIINMAANFLDLVRAAVNTANDLTLDFGLGVFEGALDSTGWSTHIRLVAASRGNEIIEEDVVVDLAVPADSPLRRRDAQIVQDRANSPAEPGSLLALARLRGYRFFAAFPLYSINQPIALFFIASVEPRDLSNEDFEIYRALTGQMSTVLQNRRLLDQTERALDETRRLYAASRAIATAADSGGVYAAAAHHLALAVSGVARVVVALAGPAQVPHPEYVQYAYVWSPASAQSDLTVGTRIARALVDFSDVLSHYEGTARLNRLRDDLPDEPALVAVLQRSGTRSVAIAQMTSRQRWFGVILVESLEEDTFTPAFGTFMQAVTDQVAIAVESIQSFEEAQSQAQRALALAEAGQLTARIGGEFAASLSEVFARVARPANYDRWLLLLRDERGHGLEMVTQFVPGLTERGGVLEVTNPDLPVLQAFHNSQSLFVNAPYLYSTLSGEDTRHQAEYFGKHLAVPIRVGTETVGVLLVGRALNAADLDERDEQLVTTLAAQVAITVENRRLFNSAEGERARLRTILDTLPAGVLVLDPVSFKPIQFNEQVERLLDRKIDDDEPFSVETFNLMQSKTTLLYDAERLPIYRAAKTGVMAVADDLSIEQANGRRIDLLVNAAPIVDARGEVTAIVTAFQDISPLRTMESELEENLRESVSQYEATRALAEADDIDSVLDVAFNQMLVSAPDDAYALLMDDQHGTKIIKALDESQIGEWTLPSELLDARELLIVSDVSQQMTDAARDTLLGLGIAAFVSMPLLARSRRNAPLGWLVMTFKQPMPQLAEQDRFLTTLNDGASVALDNRYLLQDTESALNETAALYGATTSISRSSSQDEIRQALQAALESLGPDFYACYVFEGERVMPVFNISLDDAPLPFDGLLQRHRLIGGKTSYIEDLRMLTTPGAFERDLLAFGNIRALAVVQMPNERGCLIIGYHTPRNFGSGEARYLSAVADSGAVVISNTLLLDQIRTTLDETSILYEASRALSNATSTEDILTVVVTHLTNSPITQAFLALLLSKDWDQEEALAQVVTSWHQEGENVIDLAGITLMAEQYPAWRLLASPNVVMIDDVDTDPLLDENERIGVQSLEMRSICVLPLRVAGRAIGAIVLGSRDPYAHTERDLRIYRSFAEQASLRMEASRLLAQTERRARQLATSTEVSQIASSILELNQLMPRIVDLIREAFYYDHVQIFLMDEDEEFAELRASTGDAGRQLLAIKHKLAKGSASVIGQVTARGEPIVALDTADARVVHRPNPYLPNTRSEMAVPLKLKGRVVGALDVQSNQPNAFDEDDVNVLTTLAGQISVAIDNAQLFQESSRRADEMSFLFDVTSRAAAAETLQGAIQNVADELRDSLDALSVSIYLPQTFIDADENTFQVLQPIALAGSDQPVMELSEVRLDPGSPNLIASAALNRRAMILNNVENETRYIPVMDGARAAVIVPLSSGATLIGLIAMESLLANAYDNDTLTLLRTLSGTLSAIIQNRQLLEQVQKTNDQLRELDRLKSDFLANMSHELRTPLNSIIGFSRVILKGIDGPLTEMQEQDLSTIYNSGLHLLNLINDILDQAKIAAGKMDLQFDYFEMKPVIDGVRSIGIGLVKDKPIDIFVEIASGLPQVYGDEFRTRQILLNLVSNAAKFTREGSITINVYPTFDEESGRQMIRTDVTDTGIGIAEADIPLLFEAFRQVDSSLTRTAGGTGLGLPIAKSLLEMQGGRMVVSSRVNFGSTFSVLMPVEPVADDKKKTTNNLGGDDMESASVTEAPSHRMVTGTLAPQDTQETNDYTARPPMYVKRQILIIEDNPDMVDQFRRALGREGFDVFAASLPLEAEAMAGGLHPTLIIMDVNFANGQGWTILEKMKSREDMADIPVIVVSLSPDVERAEQLGVFRFIKRPFMPEDLVDAVRAAEQESRINRILIIDDQPESIRLLQQLLDQNGKYRVFSANNGMDGIALVARRRPDLVILDLRMPEMDGFAVVKELRNNPETATIPILIVTGDSLNSQERERLTNLNVLYKSEISTDSYRLFLEGVKAYLDSKN